jgi:protein-disulfide isomerase
MAIRAFYCAFEKGKFWEVHALVMSEKGYEIQNGTDPAGTASAAPVVKNDKTKSQDLANFLAPAIDPVFMKSCLDSGKYDARLGADTQLASSLGVQGTPGFFVNATNFAGAYSFKDMQSAVDAALK